MPIQLINHNTKLLTGMAVSLTGIRSQRLCKSNLAFVPKCDPVTIRDVIRLKEFVDKRHRLCVLTGAGISTESGIPDYRSAEVGLYARSNHKPILYKEFCDNEAKRKRYWARNYIGWPSWAFTGFRLSNQILRI